MSTLVSIQKVEAMSKNKPNKEKNKWDKFRIRLMIYFFFGKETISEFYKEFVKCIIMLLLETVGPNLS